MCGIFGYSGTPGHPVDLEKIRVLGILNDSRGGNGCGLLLDSVIRKTITPPKFADWSKNQRFDQPKKTHVVLGHCRKASVGGVSEENSHPFQVQNEQGKPVLIGMHNGTVDNWKDLCKKAGVEDHNDFQVDSVGLLTLLAYAKKGDFSILSEYTGAAALAWVYNSDPNTLFLFHGASKRYNSSLVISEERPLFYWDTSIQINPDGTAKESGRQGIYFSSIKDSLEMIGALEKEVIELPFNTVFKVKHGKLIEVAKIDRSSASQEGTVVTSNNYSGSYNYSAANNRSLPPYVKTTDKTGTIPDPSIFLKNMGANDLQKRIYEDFLNSSEYYGKVYFSRGLYFRGDFPIHSRIAVYKFPRIDSSYEMVDVPFYLEEDGTAVLYSEGEKRGMIPRYFYRGILCKDFDAYSKLVKEAEESAISNRPLYRQNYAKYSHPQMFIAYSDMSNTMTVTTPALYNDVTKSLDTTRYTDEVNGEILPLFSKKTYVFERGLLKNVIEKEYWNKEIATQEVSVEENEPSQDIEENVFLNAIEEFIAETETAINDFIDEHKIYLETKVDSPVAMKLLLLKKLVENISVEISTVPA